MVSQNHGCLYREYGGIYRGYLEVVYGSAVLLKGIWGPHWVFGFIKGLGLRVSQN